MAPDLEVVQIRPGESFATISHGCPYRTVRWHFHPEYEIHLIVATSGHYFVGDFIGAFEPGNLVLTGPNLPHNWVSDIPEGTSVPLRCRVIQFGAVFIDEMMRLIPEFAVLGNLLASSPRGVLFGGNTSSEVAPLMTKIMSAQGIHRIELFTMILGALSCAQDTQCLASATYLPDPSGYMSTGMNRALDYIRENLTQPFGEADLSAIAGMSAVAFSREFRRHTGMSLVQYVKRLRINLACQILTSSEHPSITDICLDVGFNNLSNFNRQFLAEKGMPPSQFRRLQAENIDAARLQRRERTTTRTRSCDPATLKN